MMVLSQEQKLIRLCAKAGANAAKFQHFKAKTIVSSKGFNSFGKKDHINQNGKKCF